MAAVEAFLSDPVGFMDANIVTQGVSGVAVVGNVTAFTFLETAAPGTNSSGKACKVYEMKKVGDAGGEKDKLDAYWCPYADDKVNAVTLAAEADYMFTAKMDGCSFGVGMAGPDGAVRVAHANTSNSAELDEIVEQIIAAGVKDPAKSRALALAKFRTKSSQQMGQLSGALGGVATAVGPLDYSAVGLMSTTFGVRAKGEWSFYFHLYQKKGPGWALLGCFPFPNRG
jgi:hypothetical protein